MKFYKILENDGEVYLLSKKIAIIAIDKVRECMEPEARVVIADVYGRTTIIIRNGPEQILQQLEEQEEPEPEKQS